jgi:hypothetical protein
VGRKKRKGHRAFKPFKTFKRFPRYTASEGRYSGWPAVLSRRRSRRIEGRSVQIVQERIRRQQEAMVGSIARNVETVRLLRSV